MNRAAIAPTITHRVRAFLAEQGASLPPWSGLDETYGRLYELLRRRKDDPAFWGPLEDLLGAIVRNASDPAARRLPAPQAELLRSWDIEALVRELRSALPGAESPTGSRALSSFLRELSAPVLGGFLLLGFVAAGCGGSTGTEGDAGEEVTSDTTGDRDVVADPDVEAEADADEPWAVGCTLERGSVLFATIRDSEYDVYTKGDLCECFSSLNASWNDGLSELFETGTADQVAQALQEMIECCWDSGPLSNNFNDVRDAFLDGSLCYIALPYRGVTFPEE